MDDDCRAAEIEFVIFILPENYFFHHDKEKAELFFSNFQTFETLFQLHFFFFKALIGNEINTIKHRGKNIQLYVYIFIYIY